MKKIVTTAVLEEIENHLEENIDIDSLAAMTGYSRRRLQDFFNHNCGVSIGKYIRQRRLCRSATLLKLTSESITNIALRHKFDSVQSYSREFKKVFGVSPKIYRNEKFWDLANLRPPYWLSPEKDRIPEISYLPSWTIRGFQTKHQVSTERLPKETSPLKWKFVLDTLKSWEQNVHCISSFGPEKDNTQVIGVTSFFGMESKRSKYGTVPLTKTIDSGKYAKFIFTGSWDDYQHFSNQVYLFFLPKYELRRTCGKEDIEVFHYAKKLLDSNPLQISLDYYIPVE